MTRALEVTGLTVSYGGLRAVNDVSLSVSQGSLVGLIGPNGAGKTSLIDALTGFVDAQGSINFHGQRLEGRPAHARARAGLARTWQSLELFEDLSVAENLQVAMGRPTALGIARDLLGIRPASSTLATLGATLETLDLTRFADARPADLSQGQRKLVGIARALAPQPRLLLLDEPAAGLNTMESQRLGRQLRRIVEGGIDILLVDHDMGLILNVCNDIYVVDFGTVIAHGPPAAIRSDGRVIAAYLGPSAVRDPASPVSRPL
jgi:branched-chain amino acid transport system ATP-binding protein